MPKGMYKRTKKTELTSKQKWALGRKPTAQDMMLNDFLSARTAEEKRAVIEKFNELYFIEPYKKPEDWRNSNVMRHAMFSGLLVSVYP